VHTPYGQTEHAALVDVVVWLSPRAVVGAAERDLLYPADELRPRALVHDFQLPLPDHDLRPRGERPKEVDRLRILADVDEAAGPGELGPEAADVHVALAVGLGHAQERLVEPSAVVEIELGRLVDDRLGVRDGAEAQAASRYAAGAD